MTEKTGHELRLTKSSVKRIVKEETNMRVSDDAILQVMAEEEHRIKNVADAAKMIANNANRKTIQEEDIRVAYTIMRRG